MTWQPRKVTLGVKKTYLVGFWKSGMPGAEGIVFLDPGRIPHVSSRGPGYLRSTGIRSLNPVKVVH